MPANKRPRKLNYSVNQKWPKAWNKVAKAIKHFKILNAREKIEWKTKWIKNAFQIVLLKLKKYWIKPNNI